MGLYCETIPILFWVSCLLLGVGLYCEKFFLRSFFSGGALSTFIHLSLGKVGPFTLESHIHVKALKMQGLPKKKKPC